MVGKLDLEEAYRVRGLATDKERAIKDEIFSEDATHSDEEVSRLISRYKQAKDARAAAFIEAARLLCLRRLMFEYRPSSVSSPLATRVAVDGVVSGTNPFFKRGFMNIKKVAKVAGFTLPPLAIIVVPETVIHKVLEFLKTVFGG